jgi:hypothetical protein
VRRSGWASTGEIAGTLLAAISPFLCFTADSRLLSPDPATYSAICPWAYYRARFAVLAGQRSTKCSFQVVLMKGPLENRAYWSRDGRLADPYPVANTKGTPSSFSASAVGKVCRPFKFTSSMAISKDSELTFFIASLKREARPAISHPPQSTRMPQRVDVQ